MEEPSNQQVNLAEWYTASEAAKRLAANSGKPIGDDYPRKLAQYGTIRSLRISSRANLYYKPDVDGYVVEERGEKSARAKRQRAAKNKQPSNT